MDCISWAAVIARQKAGLARKHHSSEHHLRCPASGVWRTVIAVVDDRSSLLVSLMERNSLVMWSVLRRHLLFAHRASQLRSALVVLIWHGAADAQQVLSCG